MRTMRMILLALTLEFLATLGFAQDPAEKASRKGASSSVPAAIACSSAATSSRTSMARVIDQIDHRHTPE